MGCGSSNSALQPDKQLKYQIYENIKRENKQMTQTDIDLIQKSLKLIALHHQFSDSQLDHLIKNTFYFTQKGDEYIYKQKDQASLLFIILKGQVKLILNDRHVRTLQEGEYFGEFELYFQFRRSVSIKTITDCSFWCIEIQTFQKSVKEITQKEYRQNNNNLKDRKIKDFIFIKSLITESAQGWTIHLVKNRKTKQEFALESQLLETFMKNKTQNLLIQEKAVFETIKFPFIVSYLSTFKDDSQVYFLFEQIQGMDLFDVNNEIGFKKQKYVIQFYLASMILCLEYLHSMNIIYRGMKFDNIMINQEGYMILTGGFLTSKILSKQQNFRTYSIIGTPYYMAPEIILEQGYTFSADLWSLGICIYIFYFGTLPYGQHSNDPYDIQKEIMATELRFPFDHIDNAAQQLICQLLSKQPEARLGQSYKELKAHPWFDDFDFDKLLNKRLNPPFVPPKYNIQESEQSISRGDYQKDANWDQEF